MSSRKGVAGEHALARRRAPIRPCAPSRCCPTPRDPGSRARGRARGALRRAAAPRRARCDGRACRAGRAAATTRACDIRAGSAASRAPSAARSTRHSASVSAANSESSGAKAISICAGCRLLEANAERLLPRAQREQQPLAFRRRHVLRAAPRGSASTYRSGRGTRSARPATGNAYGVASPSRWSFSARERGIARGQRVDVPGRRRSRPARGRARPVRPEPLAPAGSAATALPLTTGSPFWLRVSTSISTRPSAPLGADRLHDGASPSACRPARPASRSARRTRAARRRRASR